MVDPIGERQTISIFAVLARQLHLELGQRVQKGHVLFGDHRMSIKLGNKMAIAQMETLKFERKVWPDRGMVNKRGRIGKAIELFNLPTVKYSTVRPPIMPHQIIFNENYICCLPSKIFFLRTTGWAKFTFTVHFLLIIFPPIADLTLLLHKLAEQCLCARHIFEIDLNFEFQFWRHSLLSRPLTFSTQTDRILCCLPSRS